MKINVKPGDLLEFNEIPAEYGTDECPLEFRGKVLVVDQEQNIVEVLVQVHCTCKEANCPYKSHDEWFARYTIFFDLDGSSWDHNGEWKRECEDPQWIESETEAPNPEEDPCNECASLRMQLKYLQTKYKILQKLHQLGKNNH